MKRLWGQLFGILLFCSTGFADRIFVFTGFVSTTSATGEYSFAPDRFDEPILAFTDPDGLLDSAFDLDNITLTLEFTNVISSDGQLSLYTLLNLPGPGSSNAFNNPALYLGPDNGLYPSLDEPLPTAISSSSGGSTTPTDSDNDGTPDSQDAFPNDPNEDTDTDGDLIGNNADPDDDNDLIPDIYELANNLNPLLDDANDNLDGDRQNNLEEYIADTRANDSSSFFTLESVPGNSPSFEFRAVPGRTYRLRGGPTLINIGPLGNPIDNLTLRQIQIFPPNNSDSFFFQVQVQLTNP
ncbi:MAG: hypothetical protein AAGC74_12405 [Verrucomicrobiota bacterium]